MTTINRDFRAAWRLGTTYSQEVTSSAHLTPAFDYDEVRVTAETLDTGQPVSDDIDSGTAGAISLVSFHVLSSQAMGGFESPYSDIYNRIWVVPDLLTLPNPSINVPIPFTLWNAYTVANSLTSIVGTGDTGLTLDISAPLAFLPVEEMVANVTIGATAPAIIDANYAFTFTYGSAELDFETTLIEWFRKFPELPLIEEWEWLTDVMTAWDGTEQRSALRRQPRRRLIFSSLIENALERALEYKRWFTYLDQSITVPFWQYSTIINAASAVSATKIYFNRDGTDFRDGDLAVIIRPSTGVSYLLRTTTIDADGANLDSPLTVGINVGDRVAPAFAGRLDNNTGPAMTSVSGSIPFRISITDFRAQFNRPTSGATIDTFDGLNVLDRQPIVRSAAPEIFDASPVILESPVGIHGAESHWLHPFISGGRQFTIPRLTNPTEMDWWRDFLTSTLGMREPFLMPTWFADLTLDSNPAQGSIQFETDDALYASDFFQYDTYKRFRLTNSAGTQIYRKVDTAVPQAGGTSLITLTTPLPNEVAWGSGFTIEFLNVMRLASDKVQLKHFALYTLLGLSVRTVDG